MNSLTDQQLLRDYTERRSEPAFAELVRRHVDLVYSAAVRMVRDAHLAEDVTQGAFVALAQNSRQLTNRPVVSGWLHRTAQNLAANVVRSEVRRRAREQEAAAMNELLAPEPDVLWEQIAPQLDTALSELSEPDRDAVMLRYFERKSAREMAQVLGTSEEAAQRRVSRGVERLRERFARRGVAVGAGSLAALVFANAVQAAPVGLAVTVSTAAALGGATLAATTTATAAKAIAMTTLQKTILGAALAAAVGTGIYQARQASHLRDQVRAIQQQQALLAQEVQRLGRERDAAASKLALAVTNPAGKSFNWQSVEAPDYKQYIANLRAVGCPEETIRDIIRADVHQLYAQKKKQVRAKAPKIEYWKQTEKRFIRGPGREMWEQMFALEGEETALLRSLGIEPDYNMQTVKKASVMEYLVLDFLQDDNKKAQLIAFRKELENRMALRPDNELVAGVFQARKDEAEAVRRILTPEEVFQYELRASPTAWRMRQELEGFSPTEQEYIAVFKLRKPFEDEFPPEMAASGTPAEQAKRAEAEKQIKEQTKQALGAERYSDYEMAQDSRFAQIFGFTQEANLGLAEAKQIYLLRRQAEEQASQARKEQALSLEARASTLEGIRQQTEKAIQSALGEKGWDKFNRPTYNWWLTAIHQPPAGQGNAAPR